MIDVQELKLNQSIVNSINNLPYLSLKKAAIMLCYHLSVLYRFPFYINETTHFQDELLETQVIKYAKSKGLECLYKNLTTKTEKVQFEDDDVGYLGKHDISVAIMGNELSNFQPNISLVNFIMEGNYTQINADHRDLTQKEKDIHGFRIFIFYKPGTLINNFVKFI